MTSPIIVRPQLPPGRRIIAVSDIHGNLAFFQGLMDKIHLSCEDILILVGDILEKGPDSLALLRHIMQLSKTHTIYPICGNCDGLVLRFFESDELDSSFFSFYLDQHPESTLRQLAQEGGFDQTADLPALRQRLRENYADIWGFLRTMPTILETEHLLFVHGGIPSLQNMERLNRWKCMKYDNFRAEGFSFEKYVIVGHWPTTLYHPDIPCSAPIFDLERRIISIDGACVLKVDGQLNALLIPEESSEQFSWVAYDGLPLITARQAQAPNHDPINIRWGHSQLELLKPGEELSVCRHLESGRVLPILNHYLQHKPNGLFCEDSTDYRLPVSPGDLLSLVAETSQGCLCKKDGCTGWYYGKFDYN